VTGYVRATSAIVRSAWRAGRGRLVAAGVLMLLSGASGPVLALGARALTQTATDPAGDRLVVAAQAAAVSLALVGMLTFEHFAHIYFSELGDLHAIAVELELGDALLAAPGLDAYDDATTADRMAVLRREVDGMGEGVQGVLSGAAVAVQLALTAWLLAGTQPWLLVLPLCAVPTVVAGSFAQRIRTRAELEAAADTRLDLHLLGLVVSPSAAREVRLLGLQDDVAERRGRLRRRIGARLVRAEASGAAARCAGQLVFAAGWAASVVLVVHGAVVGTTGVGDVVLVLVLAVQLSGQVQAVVTAFDRLHRAVRSHELVRTVRAAAGAGGATPAVVGDVPDVGPLTGDVEVRGVSFRYSASTRPVLQDVDLRLRAGTVVAVVGANGSGKSTLVKLLARLYRPTEGSVRVGGVDVASVGVRAWRARLSGALQDAHRFELPAWESIGLGDVARLGDREAVERAVERSLSRELLESLPDGLDTPLGRHRDDGHDLSGGQWQRLALARGMMRAAPAVLLLDEPMASLDPEAEAELVRSYVVSAREAARASGTVTVFVSHRFSTVSAADHIVVLDGGTVREQGSHDELMERKGVYAAMFLSQARAYR